MEVRPESLGIHTRGEADPTPSGGRCNELTRWLVRQQHRCASVWVSPHVFQGFHGTGITPLKRETQTVSTPHS